MLTKKKLLLWIYRESDRLRTDEKLADNKSLPSFMAELEVSHDADQRYRVRV
jgi:hypothetical protein